MAHSNSSPPLDKRRSGILLHPTSLPGPFESGVIGNDAYRFIDFLADTGYSVWQTLPLGPTHGDGSPYQSLSVHAGNPRLIDLQWLVDKGWLAEQDLHNCYAEVIGRPKCISLAAEYFHHTAESVQQSAFEDFIRQQGFWLDDYALYCALKNKYHNKSWLDWPEALSSRNKEALLESHEQLKFEIFHYQFEQFLFFSQWLELKAYAQKKGIYLFGDLPIFVAHDSADVWARREFFQLDERGESTVVAGVPPDYFSATGQRWGNPHYRWDVMEEHQFSWWIERIKTQQLLFDLIRIDHFRGFEAYWEIPADAETAIDGHWVKAPGKKLLKALYKVYPELSLVAEDLGVITEKVDALRKHFSLPGMKILQFAFSGEASNPYLPHNHQINSVVYTGTHDNDTTLSWLNSLNDEEKQRIQQYFNYPYEKLQHVLMNTAMASVAKLAILPMQDILELGEGHRMNTPGTIEGNWRWRFQWETLTDELKATSRRMNTLYGRNL
jgi:4-alpha-glucanotransferase